MRIFKDKDSIMQHHFQIIGHRGARGLYPENTITGFLEAVKLGVDAIELDVVVSKDNLLVVSHEAWMNPDFCSLPDGHEVGEDAKERYNLYKMLYADIATFDCGLRQNKLFPGQKTMKAHKPLLSEVLRKVEELVGSNRLSQPRYHIELKSDGDHLFNPPPSEFIALFSEVLKTSDIHERFIIKSFDVRMLQALRKKMPALKIALLVENTDSLNTNIDRLGFVPEMYCPEYILITPALVKEAHDHHMLVVPWTVNDYAGFQSMLEAGTDGLITDYPDRALRWRKENLA
ncbi:MAG: glycerophosphodiester phosphodiesterase family protein [Bacteroidia bacterium]